MLNASTLSTWFGEWFKKLLKPQNSCHGTNIKNPRFHRHWTARRFWYNTAASENHAFIYICIMGEASTFCTTAIRHAPDRPRILRLPNNVFVLHALTRKQVPIPLMFNTRILWSHIWGFMRFKRPKSLTWSTGNRKYNWCHRLQCFSWDLRLNRPWCNILQPAKQWLFSNKQTWQMTIPGLERHFWFVWLLQIWRSDAKYSKKAEERKPWK